jgi:hypothetical protein
MADIGRPSKFTPERRKAILCAIAKAIPYQLAAEANGIREETLYAWINRGWQEEADEIDGEYYEFSKSIKKIEMDRITHHKDKIASNCDRWQADAWILERRWYKHYGSNVHLNEMEDRLKKVEEKANKKDAESA